MTDLVPAKRVAAAAAALALLLLTAGCGREDEADLVNGKTLFAGQGTCGACHALARAGTKGTQGPDLDAAFAQARRDGMTADTVEGVVRDQIGAPRRNSIMKPDLVEGDDARDVAAYVGLAAGVAGEDTGELAQAGRPKTDGKPVEASGGTLEIAADPSGALAFVATKAIAAAGALELRSPNESPVPHNIAVKGAGLDEQGPVVSAGGVSEVSASLKPGKYTFYCSVPGHEEGGMRGDLTVE